MTRLTILIATAALTLALFAGPAAAHYDTRCSHIKRTSGWGEVTVLVDQWWWGIGNHHNHLYSHRVKRGGQWVETHRQVRLCGDHWWDAFVWGR